MGFAEFVTPPINWVGGVIPCELNVGMTEEAAMFVTHLTAYPVGFSFRVTVLTRTEPEVLCREAVRSSDARGQEKLRLHIGVEFSDGRTAMGGANWISAEGSGGLGDQPPFPERMPPDPSRDLCLNIDGVESGAYEFTADCWIWPLPPAGALGLRCGWPAAGIAVERTDIDVEILRDAAKRAKLLWTA